MLTKWQFKKVFKDRYGEPLDMTMNDLYDLYGKANDFIADRNLPLLKDVKEKGIDATHLVVRNYFAECLLEYTPNQMKDMLATLLIAKEEL